MFHRLDDARVIAEPFPHVVVEGFLDDALARELLAALPPLGTLTRGAEPGSNKRFTLTAAAALADPAVTPVWRRAIAEGTSQGFLDRVTRLFSPHIRAAFPDFASRFAPPERLAAVPRQTPGRPAGAAGLDAQISVNTPAAAGGTSVRGPHLDRTDKLFVGLLYLRHPADGSAGADLELYEAAEPAPAFAPKRLLPRDRVRLVKTVPYRFNTLVLFLNTPRSLHGVSPRAATPHPRWFLNLVGEMNGPIFDVACREPAPPPGLLSRLWAGLFGRAA